MRAINRRRTPSDSTSIPLGSAYVLFLAAASGAAAAGTLAVTHVAGYRHVVGAVARFDGVWLPVCLAAQVVAYFGYVLAVRAVARVDGGPRLSFALTTRTVVAGFGVYAATHSSGGFTVDYWALRRSDLARREAMARVLGLGALEYAVLAPAALVSALVLLFSGGGGHAARDGDQAPRVQSRTGRRRSLLARGHRLPVGGAPALLGSRGSPGTDRRLRHRLRDHAPIAAARRRRAGRGADDLRAGLGRRADCSGCARRDRLPRLQLLAADPPGARRLADREGAAPRVRRGRARRRLDVLTTHLRDT